MTLNVGGQSQGLPREMRSAGNSAHTREMICPPRTKGVLAFQVQCNTAFSVSRLALGSEQTMYWQAVEFTTSGNCLSDGSIKQRNTAIKC